MGFYHDASLGLAFESASIVQLNTATEMKKVVTYSVMSRLVAKQVVPATKGMLEIQTPDNLQDHLIRLRGIAVKHSTGLMQYAINC